MFAFIDNGAEATLLLTNADVTRSGTMETFGQDLIFALRMMRKRLGFTAAAVLCLTLGIRATSGIFTVVMRFLLRPLPYAHPEQLVRLYTISYVS